MSRYTFVIIALIAMSTSAFSQSGVPDDESIPDVNYFLVPGTMSVRLDGSDNPAIAPSDRNYKSPDYYVRGRYFGYDNGGARTNWNSSQYLDFTIFQHRDDPNWITDPHQVDSLPFSGNNGYNYSGNPAKWLGLNYRIAYPSSAYYNVDTTSKETLYPLILFMHGAGERADCWGNNCYNDDGVTTNNNTGLKNLWNNDHNLVHGGKQHLDAINRNPSDARHWPGYAVFPQNKNGYNPGPGIDQWTGKVIALIEKLIEVYPIDPNRIYIHGLSEGAQGAWMLITSRPDLFAAAAPMSGHRNNGAFDNDNIAMDTSMIHIPIWQFQGGKDNRPSPQGTEDKLNKLRNLGGTPRYTLYPNLGHGVWNTAYSEPDFFSWFLQHSKLTIHSYYGIKQVCEGDPINVRLGISKYFENYEWRKTTDGGSSYSTMPPSPERNNEIIADELGSYQVRIMRNGTWSEWSDPYTITEKQRPEALIKANGSVALPGLDGSTQVTLTTAADGIYYEWYKDGGLYAEDSALTELIVSEAGSYTLIKKDPELCNSNISNVLSVSTTPYGTSVPDTPQNLTASTSSESQINIFWEDKSDNENGFEVYRSTDNISFVWVANVGADELMYNDTMLNGGTEYFYKIRAYNASGASGQSNTASALTIVDNSLPTPPSNFKFERFDYTETRLNVDGNNLAEEYFEVHPDKVVLSWEASTDNVGVDHYEIFRENGEFLFSSTNTTATIENLNLNQNYSFYVVAVDNNGNVSNPSSLVPVTTTQEGVYFNLYAGGTWDIIKEFSDWALWDNGFGTSSNFNISAKDGLYDEGDYFAFEFFGHIYIEEAGEYTFYTRSDDGSRLWIGDEEIVDNDGLHGMSEQSGTITLSEGAYPITVQFFERSGGQGLEVRWRGPSFSKQFIPSSVLRSGPIDNTISVPTAPTNAIATADISDFSIDLTWDYETLDIVVLGSSTAEGFGLNENSGELSWVEKLDSAFAANNANYTITNLAKGGYNTYFLREDGSDGGGFVHGNGTAAPDADRNISMALSLNPDIIIVNMPSNNVADNIDIPTTISHYQELKNLADAQGVEIFFTTTQPRDFNSNSTKRHLLEDEANAVRSNFGQYVIDIYDELTDFTNDNRIKAEYALGDGTHLNEQGQYYIYTEVLNTVGPHLPKFEIYQSFSGEYNIVKTTYFAVNNYSITGLAPATNYDYRIKAVNIFGASDDSNTASAVTIADSEPPTQPQNLVVRSKSSVKIALSWDNSTDNVGVSHYVVSYQTAEEAGSGGRKASSSSAKTQSQTISTPNNGVTIEGLNPDTEYLITVLATDESSNQSAESSALSVETDPTSPLPVDLISFSYKVIEGEVILSWQTATEINNSHFEVQRTNNPMKFETIGQVQGAGNSENINSYSFNDSSPLYENLYRIKQVDFDGKFEFSNILKVSMAGESFDDLKIYPVPTTSNNINIRGRVNSSSNKITIEFIDIIGKKHLSLETDNISLMNGISINLGKQLKQGVYMVLFSDGLSVSQKKLIIR
ncbi:MAG: fibronectin type III domain-containing protein [Fulvivirga sp.]